MRRIQAIPFVLATFLCLHILAPMIALGAGRDEIVREEIAAYGDYRFVMEQRVVHYDDEPNELLKTEKMEAFLIVYKGGREIYRSDEGDDWSRHAYQNLPAIGTDITGDGSPDVVLVDASNPCCNTYYIVELRDPLNVIEFYQGDIMFKNLDHVPGLELDVSDRNFVNWKASSAGSAYPQVVLRYQDGEYVFDFLLTKKAPFSERQLRQTAFAARSNTWGANDLPQRFLQTTLDLIFSGNVMQSLEFIESSWPSGQPGKDDFIAELFQCRLREDHWWPEIARMNGLQPEEPLDDCGRRYPPHQF